MYIFLLEQVQNELKRNLREEVLEGKSKNEFLKGVGVGVMLAGAGVVMGAAVIIGGPGVGATILAAAPAIVETAVKVAPMVVDLASSTKE